VFIPVGLNYDRVLEDRTLLADTLPERPRVERWAAAGKTIAFVARNLWLMSLNRWHRFGYACACFGSPLSMREYCAARGIDFRALAGDERHARVEALGAELMRAVGAAVPVLPVSLVATVLLRHAGEPLSELELKARVFALAQAAEAAGARVYVPRRDLDYAVAVGLRMLTLRHLVAEDADGLFRPAPGEEAVLRYYANSIAHLLPDEVPPAVVPFRGVQQPAVAG
jgi:glycerol-3-phosphate O-acyltransferase